MSSTIYEKLIEDGVEERRNNKELRSIHITHDFKLRLLAEKDFDYIKDLNDATTRLMGYPVVVHTEPCEKDYWFDAPSIPPPSFFYT